MRVARRRGGKDGGLAGQELHLRSATLTKTKLYFSVVTLATLGFGDIGPVGNFARMLAGIESLLGSLLLALLVYVLTMAPG